MLVSILLSGFLGLLVVLLLSQAIALVKHVREARASGLPYIISPVHSNSSFWMLTQPLLLPILERLPRFLTASWLPTATLARFWNHGHAPFARIGHDTFLVVTPGGNTLFTADPPVVDQIIKRSKDFVKPVEVFKVLAMFGPNLATANGEESRTYRKVAAPSFGDATNARVWDYSVQQAGVVVDRWRQQSLIVTGRDVLATMGRLALHVMSFCMNGREMSWDEDDSRKEPLAKGHTLSFGTALFEVMDKLFTIMLVPGFILRNYPSRSLNSAAQAFKETKQYIAEMRKQKTIEMEKQGASAEPNLFTTLVEASHIRLFTPAAITGNVFIFLVAGHETTATTLTFLLSALAFFPSIQQHGQADIDILLPSDPAEWSYRQHFPQLWARWPGAVLREVVRCWGVLPVVPKSTGGRAQTLMVEGRQASLAPGTLVMPHQSGLHKNPRVWPEEAVSVNGTGIEGETAPWALSCFNPGMWVDDGNGVMKPESGAYVPFSGGARSCIGERFAQAEIIATMCRILKDYTIELDTTGTTLAEARKHAARELTDGVEMNLSLRMREGVGLRLVPRV